MTTRRYRDEEVREIFSLATTGSAADGSLMPTESGGLTLDDLQRIAVEAGIEPARVVQAAQNLDARGKPAPVRRFFGLPIGMSRVVPLPRAPTDREWELLVSQFRTLFDTHGPTTSRGLREWAQGDLYISVEPTEHGEQLRVSTRNEVTMVLNGFGIVTGGMSLLMGAVVASTGQPGKALAILGGFGGMALAAFGTNLVLSRRWARERNRQMEELAEHVVKLLSQP
jgi:hypothetical protein